MIFQESLDYLFGLQRFGVKLGLKNMQRLVQRLPELQAPMPCAHVAGTNGKGSVSAFLAEMIHQSGLKVGLYTSPHLHSFTERIQINGIPIQKEYLAHLTTILRNCSKDIPMTFFEATTALALMAFQKENVDFAVIETGMGGRLDATNIIDPEICLITPVSSDHREHLGNSLLEIAEEKAGIIKPNIPVVLGRQLADVCKLFEAVAEEKGSPIVRLGQDYFLNANGGNISVSYQGESVEHLCSNLNGKHQQENLAQAVVAALELQQKGFPLNLTGIQMAAQTVAWPARLEWLRGQRQILLDVAHNVAGFQSLANYLHEQKIKKIKLVVGLSGDRKPEEVLDPMKPFIQDFIAVSISGHDHVPPSVLVDWARQHGFNCLEYTTATQGLLACLKSLKSNEVLVISGSIYLVAELRMALISNQILSTPTVVGFT